MSTDTILCVEDNIKVQNYNRPLLESKGFTVITAMTLYEARETIKRETPCLIVLDIHLPDGSGLDFLRELRETSHIPVIALTNNKEESDIVTGFASGCDDYVTKPYTFPVLYARIEGLLRRAARLPGAIEKGSLRLDVLAAQAFVNGKDLLLKTKEFLILLFLVQNEDRLISSELLYETIWNTPIGDDNRTLQSNISALRIKLEGLDCGYTIRSSYGKGYCFEKV